MDILRNYLECLKSLPGDLHRNLLLLRELDEKMQRQIKQADKISAEYLLKIYNLSASQKYEEMSKIKDLYKIALLLGDDKVALAGYTYEMIDRHIKKLDAEHARFKAYLVSIGELPDPQTVKKRKGRKGEKKMKKNVKKTISVHGTRKSARQKNRAKLAV